MAYSSNRVCIGELLNQAAKLEKTRDQAEFLKAECNNVLIRQLLRMVVNPDVKFLLPEGDPPYKVSDIDEPGLFLSAIRKLYIFTNAGPKSLNPARREFLFVELLQSISPADAKLLLLVKDKKLPEGLKPISVKKAFPETMR